jgi:hypothetical protein
MSGPLRREAAVFKQALTALEAMYVDLRYENGNHPADIDAETIPGYVVVADVDDYSGDPRLYIYRHDRLIAWYQAARAFQRVHGEDEFTIVEAMYEVESEINPDNPREEGPHAHP